jgi:hypothetical protein
MSFTWGFCTVTAVFVARYCRGFRWRVTVHRCFQCIIQLTARTMQGFNTILTFPFFILTTMTVDNHVSSIHAALGLAVVILGSTQGMLLLVFW